MTIQPSQNSTAWHAVRAARSWHIWKGYCALRYCQKHGVPSGIIVLARVLATAEKAGM